MIKNKFLIFFTAFIALSGSMQSFANFCPTNYNIINIGETIESVLSKCGKPDKQEITTKKAEGPQEWSYFIPQTVTTPQLYNTQGSLKASITFDNDGRVINISVNGIGVGATTICGGYNLQLGDTREAVKRACGEPSFINKDANPATLPPGGQKDIKVTTLIYTGKPPLPDTKLIFINGVLSEQQ